MCLQDPRDAVLGTSILPRTTLVSVREPDLSTALFHTVWQKYCWYCKQILLKVLKANAKEKWTKNTKWEHCGAPEVRRSRYLCSFVPLWSVSYYNCLFSHLKHLESQCHSGWRKGCCLWNEVRGRSHQELDHWRRREVGEGEERSLGGNGKEVFLSYFAMLDFFVQEYQSLEKEQMDQTEDKGYSSRVGRRYPSS